MALLIRFGVWISTAALALGVDIVTKAWPHPLVVDHYAHMPIVLLVAVAMFLGALGIRYSTTVAIGSGLMFGGLCGNAGQLLLYGYASDWIPIGGWLTNVADIADAVGLLCCVSGYLALLRAKG